MNIFLHGWGQEGSCFKNEIARLKNLCFITVDFPPFGKSEALSELTIFSYANMVISLCDHLGLKKVNLIGHSFGGRVAILVSSMRKDLVGKLVLVSSAGMKPKRKINYYLRVFWYKIAKFFKIPLKNKGSRDYQALSEGMKKTFVSVVNTHLESYCKLIEASTLIIFGENDKETPLYMAKRLNKLIKNSQLYIIKHAGHFCFLEREIEFDKLLKTFLLEEEIE